MKKIQTLALFSAVALLATGFSACSSSDDAVVNNPNFNPETNEVLAKFVFNVSTGNQAITRQTPAATQADVDQLFRGIDDAVLLSYKLDADGKHLAAAAAADKRFDLSYVATAGTIDKDNSHRVIETSLPLNTNTLLFYGKAPNGSASEAEAAAGLTAYDIYGHLAAYQICNGDGSVDLASTNFELDSRINSHVGDFKKIQKLLAGILTCIMNTNLTGDQHVDLSAADYTIAVSADEYPNGLKWADYYNENNVSPVSGGVLDPLEKKLTDAYREMTTIRQSEGELRAGYGEAIRETVEDLWSVVNEVRCATPFSKAEAVAKYLSIRIHERIKQYFNATVPTDGTNVSVHGFETTSNVIAHFANDQAWPTTADPKPTDFASIMSVNLIDFPQKLYHVAPGSAHYLFDKGKQQFFYVENYNTAAVGGAGGFTVESYFYPAELLYFGNSPIRVSEQEHKPNTYPNGVGNWDTDTEWTADWVKNSHVTSKTQSVAMKNDINYGSALMKTTISYGATTLKDNNHAIQVYKDPSLSPTDEPDNEITVTGTTFKLLGVVISGQSKQVGWDFLPKSGTAQGYVYDYHVTGSSVIPATGSSVPNYTLVFDNYNATAAANSAAQDKVYVALELQNNSGSDFFGEHGVIRNGGTFYLIGELDPTGKAAPAWPVYHPLPPYNADGTSKKIARVFMQDYMTSANFVIGENSLKHAYLTVPDLRYSSLTLGLSVDIRWSTGIDFGDVVLGGE